MSKKLDTGDRTIRTGRKIKQARLQRGMSQRELGAIIGVSFQQIQKYENGVNELGIERLRLISDALGVNALNLAGLDDEAAPVPALSRQKVDLLEAWDKLHSKARSPLMQLIDILGKET